MKALVTYYSRAGTTKKIAETVSELLKCDIEQIVDRAREVARERQGNMDYSAPLLLCLTVTTCQIE